MWCSDNNDAACSWLDSSQQEQNTLGSGSYGDSTAYTSESSSECFQQEALNSRDTSENPDNFTPPMTSTKTSEKSNVLDDPTSATSYGTYRNSSVRSDRSSTRNSTGSGHEADTESLYSGSTKSSVSSTASSSVEELWSCFYDHQDSQAGLGGGFVSLCPLIDDLTPGSETEEEMFNAVSPMPSEEVMTHFFQGMEMGSDDVFYSDDECQQPPSKPPSGLPRMTKRRRADVRGLILNI
ncbi:hypothetical protein ACOMHN_010161 [Nucella lapillus]